jgi:glycosyltransferase involved in cell wall biosynthesis
MEWGGDVSASRPRVLAVSSQIPWPLDRGGHIRTYHMLKGLSRSFDVSLIAGDHPDAASAVEELADAGVRCLPVRLESLTAIAELARAARSALASEPYVLFGRHDRRQMRDEIGRYAAAGAFDLLYLDHLDSMVFADFARSRPIVVDMHNVCSVLLRRRAAEERRGVTRAYLRRESSLLAAMEQRAARTASAVFAVSEQERRHFAALGARHTFLVPNGVDCAAHVSADRAPDRRAPLIVFVGTMSWMPNASAAVYLCRDFLPAVQRQIPDARVRIIGRDPSAELLALAHLPGVEVVGGVPDVRPHLNEASLLAVPLDTGGGTRLKILEAFAAGLPVVSTAVGSEGIDASDGEHLLVAERDQFPDTVVRLLSDADLAERLAHNAKQLALSRYDWNIIGQDAARAVWSTLRDA